MRLTNDNIHVIEVWDGGKGVLCRVSMEHNESVTAFVQSRLSDKNCLFVCVKIGAGPEQRHVLRGYEIARNGQSCDFCVSVDLTTPKQLIATSIYMGSDALYVNFAGRLLYKVDIL